MIKVLIVSEGSHELGGALMNLVRRLGPPDCIIDQDDVRGSIHVHPGKGKGYFKRAIRWMLEAEKRGYDALVLVIDRDRISDRVHEIDDAQLYMGANIHRALGVAIRTFDAWMLADERALSLVLGCVVPRQPDPETLSQPKKCCSDILASAGDPLSQTEMYSQVARIADLAVIARRCPKGFAPFADRVRAIPSKAD